MSALRQRNDPVRLLWRRLGLVALVGLTVALGISVWHLYWKNQESIELKDEAQTQYENLAAQQSELSASIANLQSDRGVEAALRQEYGMGAQGEGMIEIVEPASATPIAASTTFATWLANLFSKW